jgi:glycogen phosphorylase
VVLEVAARDGWWIEGCNEGVTGWAISDHDLDRDEANSLYEQLERKILPLFYRRPDEWRRIMRSTIALNGSYFNTQRMLKQYVLNAYFPERRTASPTLEPRDINLSASAGI